MAMTSATAAMTAWPSLRLRDAAWIGRTWVCAMVRPPRSSSGVQYVERSTPSEAGTSGTWRNAGPGRGGSWIGQRTVHCSPVRSREQVPTQAQMGERRRLQMSCSRSASSTSSSPAAASSSTSSSPARRPRRPPRPRRPGARRPRRPRCARRPIGDLLWPAHRHDQVADSEHEHDERDDLVDPPAPQLRGRIDAEPLDPEPHERVAGDVHGEQLGSPGPDVLVDPDQGAAEEQHHKDS